MRRIIQTSLLAVLVWGIGALGVPSLSTADQQSGQSGQNVSGKVIGIGKDTLILRQDPSQPGKEVTLQVDAQKTKDFVIGDNVEAQIDSNGMASSVKKTADAQQGGGMSSSGTTGHKSFGDTHSR